MDSRLTIGKLARESGVPASTLRYYERAGLLEPAGRTDGNYRVYDESSLERIHFIRTAQAAGFSLRDIAALMGIRDGTTAPCREVEGLIERRLEDVRARLKDLRAVEQHLKAFGEKCRSSADKAHCEVLDVLEQNNPKA